MLARLQRNIIVALLSLVTGWVVGCFALGAVALACAGVATAVITYAALIAFEFVLLDQSYPAGDPDRPHIVEYMTAWAREVATAPRIFLWCQPFKSNLYQDRLIPHVDDKRGVVFVHGFLCNRGLWNPWLIGLREREIAYVAVNLEPVFGSIDLYVPIIEQAVSRLEMATGLPPMIVAHSMGGLAARAWMVIDQNAFRAHRVITIGSPHSGSRLADYSLSANAKQMRIGSPWLAGLEHRDTALSSRRFVCFWSTCDNIVFPARNATLPGAVNHRLVAPHVHMVNDPAIRAEVFRLLEADAIEDSGASAGQPAPVSVSTPRRT